MHGSYLAMCFAGGVPARERLRIDTVQEQELLEEAKSTAALDPNRTAKSEPRLFQQRLKCEVRQLKNEAYDANQARP